MTVRLPGPFRVAGRPSRGRADRSGELAAVGSRRDDDVTAGPDVRYGRDAPGLLAMLDLWRPQLVYCAPEQPTGR